MEHPVSEPEPSVRDGHHSVLCPHTSMPMSNAFDPKGLFFLCFLSLPSDAMYKDCVLKDGLHHENSFFSHQVLTQNPREDFSRERGAVLKSHSKFSAILSVAQICT